MSGRALNGAAMVYLVIILAAAIAAVPLLIITGAEQRRSSQMIIDAPVRHRESTTPAVDTDAGMITKINSDVQQRCPRWGCMPLFGSGTWMPTRPRTRTLTRSKPAAIFLTTHSSVIGSSTDSSAMIV
jgi:hypothetical protein